MSENGAAPLFQGILHPGSNGLTVNIDVDQLPEEPGHIGLMMADLVIHFTRAYEQSGKGEAQEVFQSILEIMIAEFQNPTDTPEGQIGG